MDELRVSCVIFRAPMIWNDGDAGGWCPFAGPRCPWPCPPNCQCPGERPMDVAESEDAVQFGAVDATDCGHPFPGAPQSWPWCSSSCRQCPGGCAMDVHGSDATITGRDAHRAMVSSRPLTSSSRRGRTEWQTVYTERSGRTMVRLTAMPWTTTCAWLAPRQTTIREMNRIRAAEWSLLFEDSAGKTERLLARRVKTPARRCT